MPAFLLLAEFLAWNDLMRNLSSKLAVGMLFLAGLAIPVRADFITVDYTADIATVGGTPFGLTSSIEGTTVTGYFTYSTSVAANASKSSSQDAFYDQIGTGLFLASFKVGSSSYNFTGTNNARVEVQNFGTYGFRFVDPNTDLTTPGYMSLNGTPDSNLALWISIFGTPGPGANGVNLPDPFPWIGSTFPAHTFEISDNSNGGGELLLQFEHTTDSMAPEPSSFVLMGLGIAGLAFHAIRRLRRTATILRTS